MIKRLITALLLTACVAVAQNDEEWASGIGQKDQVTKGLVSYYSMRVSGLTVYDEVGRFNGDGGNVAFAYTNGVVGIGGRYKGSADAKIDTSDSFSISNALSISMWVNMRTTNLMCFASNIHNDSPDWNWQLQAEAGKVEFACSAAGSASVGQYRQVKQTTSSMTTNVFYHVVLAATPSSDSYAVYIDGTSTALTTSGNAQTGIHISQTVWIGARAVSVPDRWFSGLIDEVRIYNRAITADEVKQLYRMGKVIYENR